MTCPKCGSAQVFCLDSRQKGQRIQRRKECRTCGARFNTVEILVDQYESLLISEEGLERAISSALEIVEILKREGLI